jgi:hypothetical protein
MGDQTTVVWPVLSQDNTDKREQNLQSYRDSNTLSQYLTRLRRWEP